MYLQKCTQFAGGEYVGADLEGNLYIDIIVFMINGIKTSLSIFVGAFPKNKLNDPWQFVSQLSEEGF